MAITDDPRVIEFRTQIKERVSELTDYVAKGKCQSLDDYRKQCGRITGLNEAVDVLLDVLKHYDDKEEDF